MPKRSRFFISATLVAVLFASLFVLSPVRTRACPDSPPETLLSLYLTSDLIVVAEITGEETGEALEDNEYYTSAEIYRSLKVSSTLKGKAPADLVFTQLNYQYKAKPFADENAEYETEESDLYSPYGYRGYSELKVGERYLFFFVWDEEVEKYDLTDTMTGARKLSDYDLEVHKKRLRELQSIVKMKKNQIGAVTAWMVRLVEEPSTRWDGVLDLSNSFDSFEYEKENDESADQTEETRLGENFDWAAIARNMTAAQKERLSNIAFGELQQDPLLMENYDYYGLAGLVRRWDKTRLAMYAFNALQGVDPADFEKIKARMQFIAQVTGDEKLAEIAEQYPAADDAPEIEEENSAKKTEENTEENNPAIEVKYEQAAATGTKKAEQTNEQSPEKAVESSEAQTVFESQPEAKKLAPAEMRVKLFTDFVDRYQYLLIYNFQVPETPEISGEPNAAEK
jgi:hypothetical protein